MKLIMECEHGHISMLTVEGMSREWAEEHGRVLDGTSAMYVKGPVKDSTWIGVCQHGRVAAPDEGPAETLDELRRHGGCGGRFRCRVVD